MSDDQARAIMALSGMVRYYDVEQRAEIQALVYPPGYYCLIEGFSRWNRIAEIVYWHYLSLLQQGRFAGRLMRIDKQEAI